MQTVYIETTIPSYLAAHPSNQEPMASHQMVTHEWWKKERSRFLLFAAIVVRSEISRGDAGTASRREIYLQGIPDIDISPETTRLATEIIRVLRLPQKAQADASHLALCILHKMDYLLTWNCTHLANPVLQKELIDYCTLPSSSHSSDLHTRISNYLNL